jgi:hypothetical protein
MARIDPGDMAKGLTAEGSGRVATYLSHGLIHSYTLECNYNTGRVGNEVPPTLEEENGNLVVGPNTTTCAVYTGNPEKYTPSSYASVGRACVIAMLDIRSQNKQSRIPKSKYKTLDRLRSFVAAEVRGRREYRNNNNSNANNTPPMVSVVQASSSRRKQQSSTSSTSSSGSSSSNNGRCDYGEIPWRRTAGDFDPANKSNFDSSNNNNNNNNDEVENDNDNNSDGDDNSYNNGNRKKGSNKEKNPAVVMINLTTIGDSYGHNNNNDNNNCNNTSNGGKRMSALMKPPIAPSGSSKQSGSNGRKSIRKQSHRYKSLQESDNSNNSNNNSDTDCVSVMALDGTEEQAAATIRQLEPKVFSFPPSIPAQVPAASISPSISAASSASSPSQTTASGYESDTSTSHSNNNKFPLRSGLRLKSSFANTTTDYASGQQQQQQLPLSARDGHSSSSSSNSGNDNRSTASENNANMNNAGGRLAAPANIRRSLGAGGKPAVVDKKISKTLKAAGAALALAQSMQNSKQSSQGQAQQHQHASKEERLLHAKYFKKEASFSDKRDSQFSHEWTLVLTEEQMQQQQLAQAEAQAQAEQAQAAAELEAV